MSFHICEFLMILSRTNLFCFRVFYLSSVYFFSYLICDVFCLKFEVEKHHIVILLLSTSCCGFFRGLTGCIVIGCDICQSSEETRPLRPDQAEPSELLSAAHHTVLFMFAFFFLLCLSVCVCVYVRLCEQDKNVFQYDSLTHQWGSFGL